MRTRWIGFLAAAALISAACSSPEPEITNPDPTSPFQDELDARVHLSFAVVGDGTVSQDITDIRPGRPVTITAVPELGSQFVAWSGDVSGDTASLELRPETDLAITATFEPVPPIGPTFTINIDGEGWVSRQSGPIIEGEIFLRAIPANGWEFTGWSGMVTNATNPVQLPMVQDNEITAHFAQANGAAPLINVWGGDTQRYELGVPQRWINIRGNVSANSTIRSLTYTVNGTAGVPLEMGPDTRRLQDLGDFNIELDTETLLSGRNDVEITAFDDQGNVGTARVTVDFTDNEWPLPYQTNWGAAGAVEDQAQVVDGIWTVGADGIRTAQIGYDRLVALGDDQWIDYEAEFTVTIHEIDTAGFDPTSEPFVGILLRWPGHSFDGVDDVDTVDVGTLPQPRWYYWPAGSLSGYYLALDGTSQVKIETNESIQLDDAPEFVMDLDTTYSARARVQTGSAGVNHRLKVWPEDTDEPLEWTVNVTEETNDAGPPGGSLLLIAHYFDVTFGDVTVNPIG